MEDEQQKMSQEESDARLRELYRQLIDKLGAESHQDALMKLSHLQERSGVLAVVMDHLKVSHHWQVVGTLNRDAGNGSRANIGEQNE